MSPSTTMFVLSCLVLGTLTTLTGYHMFVVWVGLEINTFAIIPFMMSSKHPRATEASTKYFLIQASASITFLLTTVYHYWTTGQWGMTCCTSVPSMIMTMTLLVKLGVAPFHFWMPEVLQGLNLKTALMVSTWMKIPPMALLYQITPSMNVNLTMMMGMLSVVVGAYGMINQTGTRKILAYSSIGNFGWTLTAFPLNPYMAILNFVLYIMVSIPLFMIFHKLPQNNMLQMKNAWYTSPLLTLSGMMLLMSLSGLPPLTGFMAKLMIINTLAIFKLYIFAFALLILSLLASFSYLRLCYFTSMFLYQHPFCITAKWQLKSTTMTFVPIMTILSSILLPMTPICLILL